MGKHRKFRGARYFTVPFIYVVVGVGVMIIALTPILGYVTTFYKLFISNITLQDQTLVSNTAVNGGTGQTGGTIDLSTVHWPNYGEQYGNLSCPEIGLDVAVYWGDDNAVLRSGAGTFIGSGIPGDQSTLLISAHNTSYFATLDQIKAGDVVTFTTTYGIYQYQITDTKVLYKDDYSAFDLLQNREQLVLYTCYHIPGKGVTDYRLYVYGDRISGPQLVTGGAGQ